jgi:hypothetical protein
MRCVRVGNSQFYEEKCKEGEHSSLHYPYKQLEGHERSWNDIGSKIGRDGKKHLARKDISKKTERKRDEA